MNDELDSDERLPAAHPAFTAHFISGFYDADDFMNDDVPPFGTDEGSDEVREWGGRLDVLERQPTLRGIIGADADRLMAASEGSNNVDDDDVVISLGFTLLRYTGQIDTEGRDWLLAALRRQDSRYPERGYAAMLQDVSTFDAASDRKDSARHSPAPWLDIRYGGGDRDLDKWCRHTVRAAESLPAWRAWWSTSNLDRLTLELHIISTKTYIEFHRPTSRELMVIGASRPLGKVVRSTEKLLRLSDSPPDPPLLTLPRFTELFEALIVKCFDRTTTHLALQPPPGRLP